MSIYKSTFYVVTAALILMTVNSKAMTQIQDWVTHVSANYYSSQVPSGKRNSPQVVHQPKLIQMENELQLSSPQVQYLVKPITAKTDSNQSEKEPKHASVPITVPVKKAVVQSLQEPRQQQASTQLSSLEPRISKKNIARTSDHEDTPGTVLPELVLYPDEIVIAFPKKIASTENVQKAISRVLLSSSPLSETNLLKTQPIDLTKRPYFYRRALDQHKEPIRYPMQALKYADYLLDHHAEEYQDENGKFITLHIPLVEYGISGPAKNYQAWVENYAKEFKVPPSLVYAVMETESAFNPNAVSRSNAIGLMQLKADAAGKDVYQLVDAKPGQPSMSELFDSKSNIRMGTAYLGLLKHDYLANIVDERIKQMVTISSYNGGLKTVLGLFGNTPEAATRQLNRMSPNQVYRKLRFEHQSDETRRYLEKVLKAESKYRDLLSAA